MFAKDRDLLILEPNIFRDGVFLTQRLSCGEGDISESLLSASDTDVGFDAAGVDTGHVVVVDEIAYEVLERQSVSDLVISRLRPRRDGTVVQPSPATQAAVCVATYAPQLEAAHQAVLRMAGIETSGQIVPGAPKEAMICNPEAFIPVECLHALAAIYNALGAGQPADAPANQRSVAYQRRFEAESERVLVHLDMNGDGVPDAVRRLAGGPMVR